MVESFLFFLLSRFKFEMNKKAPRRVSKRAKGEPVCLGEIEPNEGGLSPAIKELQVKQDKHNESLKIVITNCA